jgi:RNA polymerase sigma-70 factor (ECF subfamily)
MHSSTATPEFDTIRIELAARFERDAVPLIAAFYPQAMKLTRNRTRQKICCRKTAAKAFAGFTWFSRRHQPRRLAVPILLNTHISGYRKQQATARAVADRRDHRRPTARRGPATRRSGCAPAETRCWIMLGDTDVRAAMQQLPEKLRTAVYYADIEGRRFKEIAAITDVPIGTVMSRLHRGRHRLRALLAEVARDRGYGLTEVA